VRNGSRWNAQIAHIVQPELLGLAHAAKTARWFLGDSSSLMFHGDNTIYGGVRSFIMEFATTKVDALVLPLQKGLTPATAQLTRKTPKILESLPR
jgi:glucose-1-phosphate thymidylyltransferase